MCKKINRFFPILMLCYVGGSYVIGYLLKNIQLPVWMPLIISQLLILVPVCIYALVQKINIRKNLPYRLPGPFDFLLSLIFGYSLIPLVYFLNYMSLAFSTNKIQQATSGIMQSSIWLQLFLIAVIPAFVEEFVFRGVFYHSYRKNGMLRGALLSGLIFGMVHLNINQFIYAFVLGFIFAMIVEATGSMFTSMTAHFAINSYSIIMMALVPDSLKNNVDTQVLQESIRSEMMWMIILVWGAFAIAFTLLSYLILKLMSKRAGRWEYFYAQIKKGFKAQNNESILTASLVVTLTLCLIYMILMEYIM